LSQPTLARGLGQWTAQPALLGLCALAALAYLLAAARWSHERERLWSPARTASFLAGLAVICLALASGLERYADALLSLHMVQHLLLMLAAPALLLWGAPLRLALGTLRGRARRGLGRALARLAPLLHPLVGLALFAAVALGTHLTGLYELSLREPAVHTLEHGAFLAAGLLYLAPLIAADPLPHAPAPLARFASLMGAMAAMAVPGALLTFSEAVRYPSYLAPARELGRSALADQRAAGALMWVAGGAGMLALGLALAMRALLAEERRQRRREQALEGTVLGA
jgi:cytochrome c oxidase assembly factor CtaG